MALIFSDTHFHNWEEFALPWKDGCNTRLRSQIETLEKVFKLAKEMDQKFIVFLGDWFHHWDSVRTSVYSMVTRKLFNLLSQNEYLKMIMLPGNHDMPNKRNWGIHTLAAYAEHPSIKVIDQPTLLNIEGQACAFVPYHQDHAHLFERARGLSKSCNSKAFLFSHLDIVGAMTCLDGYTTKAGLKIEDLAEEFVGGIFGHYHMPQEPNHEATSFVYTGAPMHLGWVDAGMGSRGVTTMEGGNMRWHPIDSPRFVKFDASSPPEIIRPQDYHIVTCDADVAFDVERTFKQEGMMLGIAPRKKERGGPVVVQRTVSTQDAIDAWVTARGEICELDIEMLTSYGKYYIEGLH